MQKQKQIKIYSFGRVNIANGLITSEDLKENIITLTESFLTFAFECYKNEKLEDGILIDEIIKVMLPDSEEEAKLEWDNGLTFNDKKYYAWFANINRLKRETTTGSVVSDLGYVYEGYGNRDTMTDFTGNT